MKTLLLSLILCSSIPAQAFSENYQIPVTLSGHLIKMKDPTGGERISLRPTFFLSIKDPKEAIWVEVQNNTNLDTSEGNIAIYNQDTKIDFGQIPNHFIRQIQDQKLGGKFSISVPFSFTIPFDFVDYYSKVKKSPSLNFGCGITGCGTGGESLIGLTTQKKFALTLESHRDGFYCFKKSYKKSISLFMTGQCQ